MNIPSIESLLSELDKYKRAYESCDAQILSLKEQRNRLTAERDNLIDAQAKSLRTIVKMTAERDEAINCAKNNELYIVNLAAERDRFANMISESSNRWQEMMAALREAKEALVMNIVGTGGRTPAAHNAIATINKVLGDE